MDEDGKVKKVDTSEEAIDSTMTQKQSDFFLKFFICMTQSQLEFPTNLYALTNILRPYDLALSDTIDNNAWDSLISCLLQQATQDFVQDNFNELLPLDPNESAQLEIELNRLKRISGEMTHTEILEALGGKRPSLWEHIEAAMTKINATFGVNLKLMLFDGSEESKAELARIEKLLKIEEKVDKGDAPGDDKLGGEIKSNEIQENSIGDGKDTKIDDQELTKTKISPPKSDMADKPLIDEDDNAKKLEPAQAKTPEMRKISEQYVTVWFDPVGKLFHNIILRELLYENVEEFCDALLEDIVTHEEVQNYHLQTMEPFPIADIVPHIQQRLGLLAKIESISDLISVALPDADPEHVSSLKKLAQRESQVTPDSRTTSLLYRCKQQYAFGMKKASDLIFQSHSAQHRDKLRQIIEKEEDMVRESDRLMDEQIAAEEEKAKREQEIRDLEKLIAQKTGDRSDLLALIEQKKAELAKTAENLEIAAGRLDYNQFRKGLSEAEPSYEVSMLNVEISNFKKLTTLRDLVSYIYSVYNKIARPKNANLFWKYVAANDTLSNRNELIEIIATCLQDPARIVPNKEDFSILEITGRQIVTSQILGQIKDKTFRELRLVAGSIIYVDSNFENGTWHGKNLVISSPVVEIKGNVSIDLSGLPAPAVFSSQAVTANPGGQQLRGIFGMLAGDPLAGRSGMDGQDGAPGESSGHFMLQADVVRNGGNLNVVASGGQGASGQSGEHGRNGRHGYNGHNPDFGHPTEGGDFKAGVKFEAGSYGTPGQRGGNGGRAGLGGEGGHKGNLSLPKISHNIKLMSKVGTNGQDGRQGGGGSGGQGGYDGVDIIWYWIGGRLIGEWHCKRGKVRVYRRYIKGITGGLWGWWIEMSKNEQEARASKQLDGNRGNDGATAQQRSNQRRTASAKQEINKAQVSILSSTIRSMYGTSAAIQEAVTSSENEKRSLEQTQRNLNQQKNTATASAKRLEEEIKAANESKDAAENAKAQLEEMLRINLENQKQLDAAMKQVAAEKHELAENTRKEALISEGVGQQVSSIFEQHSREQVLQMRQNSEQVQQTSLVKDYVPPESSEDLDTKEIHFRTTHHPEIESLYDEVRLVKNVHKLSDEFFAIAIAARSKDPGQGGAFELGLQSIKSFTKENKLPLYIRQYLDFQSIKLAKKDSTTTLLVEYLRDQLPQDVKVTLQTQDWLKTNIQLRTKIFKSVNYVGDSVGEFLFRLRKHDEKNDIVAIEAEMHAIMKTLPLSSKGRILLDHICTIVYHHLENWFISEVKNSLPEKAELDTRFKTFANFVDDFYRELRSVHAKVGLLRTYEVCLAEIMKPEFNTVSGFEIFWERAALILLDMGGNDKKDGCFCIWKNLNLLTEMLRGGSKSKPKIEKLNIIPKLIFITDYVKLTCAQVSSLVEKCDLILAASHGPGLLPIYDKILELKHKFYSRYVDTIQKPALSRITAFTDGIGDKGQQREIHAQIEDVISNIIEANASPLSLQHRQHFYERIEESVQSVGDKKTGVNIVIKDIHSSVRSFKPASNLDKLQDIAYIITNGTDFRTDFNQALSTLTSYLGTQSETKLSPEFIIGLNSWLKAVTMSLLLLQDGVQLDELIMVGKSIGDFIRKNLYLSSYGNFLIRDTIRDLQLVLSKKMTLSTFLKQKEVYEKGDKSIDECVELKVQIVKFVENYLTASDEVVGLEEITASVDMHLDKIFVAMLREGKGDEVAALYSSILNKLEGSKSTAGEFLGILANVINAATTNAVTLKISALSTSSFVQEYNRDPFDISNFEKLLNHCVTNILATPSDFTPIIEYLLQAFVAMQVMNPKNYQISAQSNTEFEKLCEILAKILSSLTDTFEKHQSNLSLDVMHHLDNLQNLVVSVAERDNSTLAEFLREKLEDFQGKRETNFNKKRTQLLSRFDDLVQVYSDSEHGVLSFTGVAEVFLTEGMVKFVKICGTLNNMTEKEGHEFDQLYFESLLKYFNLQAIPTMPTNLRADVFHLVATKGATQLGNVLNTFHSLIEAPSQETDWIMTFLIILNKLIVSIPTEKVTCVQLEGTLHMLDKCHGEIERSELKNKCIPQINDIQASITSLSRRIIATKGGDPLAALISQDVDVLSCISPNLGQCLKLQCKLFSLLENHSSANIFNSHLRTIVDAALKSTLGVNIPPVGGNECLVALRDLKNPHVWKSILAVASISVKINLNESSFLGRVATSGYSATWEPSITQINDLVDSCIKTSSTNDLAPDDGNRFIFAFLDEDVTGSCIFSDILTSHEKQWIELIFSFSHSKQHGLLNAAICDIFVNTGAPGWNNELESLAYTTLFGKFVAEYKPLFSETLGQIKPSVSAQSFKTLQEEVTIFLQSHKEVLRNREALQLSSSSLIAHRQAQDAQGNTSHEVQEHISTIKHFVEQFIVLKYNFNRSIFFAGAEGHGSLWFEWMRLLHQRCTLRKLPLPEFNALLQRSVDLPVPKLVSLISQTTMEHWLETIYFHIAVQNYITYLNNKEKASVGKTMDVESNVTEMTTLLKALKPTPFLKRFLLMLGDKIMMEIQLAEISGATPLELDKFVAVISDLTRIVISDKLIDNLEKHGISQWAISVREHVLLQIWPPQVATVILKLEGTIGKDIVSEFVGLFEKKFPGKHEVLVTLLEKFVSRRLILDEEMIISFKRKTIPSTTLPDWESWLAAHAVEINKRFRDVHELARLMRNDEKNQDIKLMLNPQGDTCKMEVIVVKVNALLDQVCKIAPPILTPIGTWQTEQIINWAVTIRSFSEQERRQIVEKNKTEVLAVLCQALRVFTSKTNPTTGSLEKPGFLPRDTQLASVILLIDAFYARMGRLAEISTGEGKTFITAMMATFHALAGDDVDVITSSPILAVENVREVTGYFSLFGISVTNNCDKECEQHERARKERYQCQVIYGDVGSFQRDILLTKLFDKGITMNRTTETVIVDEVDSMLLDKGENILYLSHSIPDLKHLWPLMIEIWQATHGPDVLQGRRQDISLVVCFIRERMRSGDIFMPNRLRNFVERRLPIWVKNAFIAEHLLENDPYIVADLDKRGTKVIIVDKDTGVEQVQMHWSNGLHQFLQLKHGDRVTPESLKAVFMSNIGYFQQFRGRLYGITGTLGSFAERHLLTECYGVDFFSMPRFKASKAYEEDGLIGRTNKEWLDLISQEVHQKTKTDSRAVLIICENVASVDKIAEKLKETVSSGKMYSYKSSFDEEFHRKNRSSPLSAGDVIIATNLAGRGTDLKTSLELEQAGGLHVILSYMTGNIRIEVQAFGRTARAGLSGTVQFIIRDPTADTKNPVTIDQLRQLRDMKEAERLENFRTKSMQRIEIEEHLCSKFNTLYANVATYLKSSGLPQEYKDLQLEFLKNQWALWLDSISEQIKILHITGRSRILEQFSDFERTAMTNISRFGSFATGALEHTKLGRYYQSKEEYGRAISCFDMAINSEPNYAEISHYYKAACILKENMSGMTHKRRAIYHLKSSESVIRKRIAQVMTASQTLDVTSSIRREAGVGTGSNRFEKQVKSESELYQVHVGKIQEAIGSTVDAKFFENITGVNSEQEGEEIFACLRRHYNIVKSFRLSRKIRIGGDNKIYIPDGATGQPIEVEWPNAFRYCRDEIVNFLRERLGMNGSSRVIEPEGFSYFIQTQTSFWTMLGGYGFFENEVQARIQMVNENLDGLVVPERLMDYKNSLTKILGGKSNQAFSPDMLSPLGLMANDLQEVIDALVKVGILVWKTTYSAKLSSAMKDKLKWNATKGKFEGIPAALQKYEDIIQAIIEDAPSSEDDYVNPDKSTPSLKLELSLTDIPLPDTAQFGSRQLWGALNESGVIKDCKVNFQTRLADNSGRISDRLEEIQEAIEDLPELKQIYKRYNGSGDSPSIDDVMEAIKTTIGNIKIFPDISVDYQKLEEYFRTGEYPPEIEEFRYMVFLQVLECTEYKSWWDWGAFIVAMLGVAQIIAGVLLEVFTAGIGTYIAGALISEGVGDIAFAIEAGLSKNFSWKSYRDHKIISVCISIVTCGVGAWLSKGAQVSRFAGKAGFQLFKAVALRVIKKAGQAVLFKLIDIGIDKLLEHIQTQAIKNCGSQLESLFLSDPGIKSQLAELQHKMDFVYQHSYEPGQAEKVIRDGLTRVLADMQGEGFGVKMGEIASKVTSGMASAIGKASGKLLTHGKRVAENMESGNSFLSKAAKLAQIAEVIDKVIKGGEIAKQLLELVNLAPQVLTRLCRHLEMQGINLKTVGKDKIKNRNDSGQFVQFKSEFTKSTKDELVKMLLSKVNSGLVAPAFQDLTQSALKKAGKAVEKNTKAILHSLRTPKEEEIKILKTLRRREALNEPEIAGKIKGKIYLEELDPATPIKNADGKSIQQLRECYGDSISVYKDQMGKFHVERPSFEDSIKNFGQGRKAGFYELMICAKYYGQTVEISDLSGELETSGTDGKVRIHPDGTPTKDRPPLRMAYQKGENGFGYFSPIVNDEIVPLSRSNSDTINTNLYQSLNFLAGEKNVKFRTEEWDKLMVEACSKDKVKGSLANISKYAGADKTAKFLYETGAYEVGNDKLWQKSKAAKLTGITSPSRFDRRAKLPGLDNMDNMTVQTWKGNSLDIVVVGDTFAVLEKPTTIVKQASFEMPNLDPAIDAYIKERDAKIEKRLNRAVSQYLKAKWETQSDMKFGESRVQSSGMDHPELENLTGYPSSLVRARTLRDSAQNNFGRIASSRLSDDFNLPVMEFKVHGKSTA